MLLMVGCVTTKEVEIQYVKYPVPETLLSPCTTVDIKYETNGDLLTSLIDLNASYRVCSEKVNSLRELLSKADFMSEASLVNSSNN